MANTGLIQTGTQIGNYKIKEFINSGGMAEVYKAYDLGLGIDVALKILFPQFGQNEEFVARFQREARSAAQLSHPNIMRVFTAGNGENGESFIAMEYIPGGSLEDRLIELSQKRQLLDTKLALFLMRQVANALNTAHTAGIVHRDLKPSNILLRTDNTPVLTDLGIAFIQNDTRLTQTSSMVGTPDYMSPEQSTNGELDGRSDIYSFGIMLYELFAGRRPFAGETPWRVIHQHIYDQPVPLQQLRKGLSAQTYNIVGRCLQKNPAARFQSAYDLVLALDQAIAVESGRTPVPGTGAWKTITWTEANIKEQTQSPRPSPFAIGRRSSKRLTPLWWIGGGIGLLLAGIIGFLVYASTIEREPIRIAAPPPATENSGILAESLPTNTPRVIIATSTVAGADPDVDQSDAEEILTSELLSTQTKTPASTATQAATSTPIPGPSKTATQTEVPATQTATPSPTSTDEPVVENQIGIQPGDGLPIRFENNDRWGIGDQQNGTLLTSTDRFRNGSASGRLDYTFQSGDNDFVVFLQSNTISGQPNGLTAWVYGDGSGHFLNTWIRDAEGQIWQVPLGQIFHTGWSQMTGAISTDQDWPWSHISGPNDGEVDYPITFHALVLDDFNNAYTGNGTIFVDDINSTTLTEAQVNVSPSQEPTVAAETEGVSSVDNSTSSPLDSAATFDGDLGRIIYTSGNTLLTTDPSWSSAEEIGTASANTCGSLATSVTGESFQLYRNRVCSIGGPDKCTSPNGLRQILINSSGGVTTLNIRNNEDGTNGDFVYSGSVDRDEGLIWAPDSSYYIWVVNDQIHIGYADGGFGVLYAPISDPLISPDSRLIMYRKPVGPGVNDIFVGGPDGSNERNVTNNLSIDKLCAAWRLGN